MIELTTIQRRTLRADAHHLNPVVSISQNGLTESVLKEIDLCLAKHELIKVKVHGIERDDRAALFTQVCEQLDCAPVQHIGNIFVLWREKPEEEKSAPAPKAKRAPKPKTKKQAAAALERPRRKTTRT